MSLLNLRKKIRRELERYRPGFEERVLPGDPVEFCREWLGYEPYEYMWPFLRDEGHFIANLQARQNGKTFNGMAKLIFLGVFCSMEYSGLLLEHIILPFCL